MPGSAKSSVSTGYLVVPYRLSVLKAPCTMSVLAALYRLPLAPPAHPGSVILTAHAGSVVLYLSTGVLVVPYPTTMHSKRVGHRIWQYRTLHSEIHVLGSIPRGLVNSAASSTCNAIIVQAEIKYEQSHSTIR
eukprot:173575-Rhodomonas_salina.1